MPEARKPQYPPNHQPGMRVPKGGSSCASCEHLGKDGRSCTNRYFIEWHGSNRLPAAADEYCSDWWEPQHKQAMGSAKEYERFPGKLMVKT
jgi:hypothetical protein